MPRVARVASEPEIAEESREDRFITALQKALEEELEASRENDSEGNRVLDIKERNALYANCIKFLAVLTKFTGDDGEGSYWGN